MATHKIGIEEFLQLSKDHLVIDVRSEGEYNLAHIPDAHNLPLFNNEERKVVGTLYKQVSREDAIKKGLDFYGVKMRSMVESVEKLINNNTPTNKTVLVHCWRGGMRSAGVGWLLDLYGFKVYTLSGGYKGFRQWAIRQFNEQNKLLVLGGFTGSGKTVVLHQLNKQNETTIDLEGLAGHKGSAFGRIGLPEQPTQEMFENRLALTLAQCRTTNKPVWIEDESQRIGSVNIPQPFWEQMRKSPVCFLDIPFEQRLNYLVETYGKLDPVALGEAIVRIQKKLGGLETKTALEFLQQNNMLGCFNLLLKYYDKLYGKSLEKRPDPKPPVTRIVSTTVDGATNAGLLKNRTHGQH